MALSGQRVLQADPPTVGLKSVALPTEISSDVFFWNKLIRYDELHPSAIQPVNRRPNLCTDFY